MHASPPPKPVSHTPEAPGHASQHAHVASSVAGPEVGASRAGTTGSGVMRVPLMLASRSPRRRLLLEEWGFPHEAQQPGFEDGVLGPGGGGAAWKEIEPEQWVVSLAYLKAWAGSKLGGARGRIVLGADTTCVVDGEMAGTPTTPEEARAMLRSMVGKRHDVITGVALIDMREAPGSSKGGGGADGNGRRMFADRASVSWGELSDEQIDEYVASGGWMGKAGGYNLAERLAAGWPIQFEGDETTIMGLPMRKLRGVLEQMEGAERMD